jgi:hypothetical protein
MLDTGRMGRSKIGKNRLFFFSRRKKKKFWLGGMVKIFHK